MKVRVRPRTHESYAGLVRLHVIPSLGAIKLQQLSTQHIQKLLSPKKAAGLSANTIGRIRDVLWNGLSDAFNQELVSRNVAKQASPPHVEPRETAVWSVAERGDF